jgi:hypothetical protein
MSIATVKPSLYHWHWSALYQPRGIFAGVGIVMGLGRLFGLGTGVVLLFGLSAIFGFALLLGGLALLVTLPIRLSIAGRIGASIAVFCYTFMGVGSWGTTASLLYLFFAILCIFEVISRRVYDC